MQYNNNNQYPYRYSDTSEEEGDSDVYISLYKLNN